MNKIRIFFIFFLLSTTTVLLQLHLSDSGLKRLIRRLCGPLESLWLALFYKAIP